MVIISINSYSPLRPIYGCPFGFGYRFLTLVKTQTGIISLLCVIAHSPSSAEIFLARYLGSFHPPRLFITFQYFEYCTLLMEPVHFPTTDGNVRSHKGFENNIHNPFPGHFEVGYPGNVREKDYPDHLEEIGQPEEFGTSY